MVRTVRVCSIPRTTGDEIIVVDASDHGVRSRWHAHRVINAMRVKLPPAQAGAEIVVLTGGDAERPTFGSSPRLAAFIRKMKPQLSDDEWQTRELDW